LKKRTTNFFSDLDLVPPSTGEEDVSPAVYQTPLTPPLFMSTKILKDSSPCNFVCTAFLNNLQKNLEGKNGIFEYGKTLTVIHVPQILLPKFKDIYICHNVNEIVPK